MQRELGQKSSFKHSNRMACEPGYIRPRDVFLDESNRFASRGRWSRLLESRDSRRRYGVPSFLVRVPSTRAW